MFRVIAFDWGNTLTRSYHAAKLLEGGWRAKLLRQAGFRVPAGFARAFDEERRRHEARSWGSYKRFDWYEPYKRAFGRCGAPFSDKKWRRFTRLFLLFMARKSRLFPGVRRLLASLKKKGYLLVLVSNAKRDVLRAEMRRPGISQYFRFLIVSETERAEKSHLKPFRTLLRLVNKDRRRKIQPHEILMVGDRADEDTYAGKMGMKTVLLTHGLSHEPGICEKADWEIDDIRELPALLKRIG
jgi:HAD superfamily hydrolase (TIGR01662 family)